MSLLGTSNFTVDPAKVTGWSVEPPSTENGLTEHMAFIETDSNVIFSGSGVTHMQALGAACEDYHSYGGVHPYGTFFRWSAKN